MSGRWGDPEQRADFARVLNERRMRIGWSHEKVAYVAGFPWAGTHKILTGRRGGSWFTLRLFEQAIERGEAAPKKAES